MKTIENILKQKVGNTYLYEGRQVTLFSYEILADGVDIRTNEGTMEIAIADIMNVLAKFQAPIASMDNMIELEVAQSSMNFQTLKTILYDSMNKVAGADGANYIKQSEAVSGLAGRIIEIEKTRIEALKLIRRK